jgi:hypothetical protein
VPVASSTPATTSTAVPIQNTPVGSAVEAAQSTRVLLPATTPTVARNDDSPTLTISEAAKAA